MKYIYLKLEEKDLSEREDGKVGQLYVSTSINKFTECRGSKNGLPRMKPSRPRTDRRISGNRDSPERTLLTAALLN